MIFHSSFETAYLWLPLLGFGVGLIGTLIGGGGGFFFMPVLILLFNVPAQVALTTSLAATIPICIVGTVGHYRKGNVDLRTGLIFVVAGTAGAFAGASFTGLVSATTLKVCWGVYTILIGIQILVNNYIRKREEANGISRPSGSSRERLIKGSFYGILAGVITSTFGTSGATPVQAGMFAMRIPIKVVIGTTLMAVLVNTASSLGAHLIVGDADLTLVALLTAGSVIGSIAGPRIIAGARVENAEGPIRKWYALGLIVFGIVMIVANRGSV